MSELDKLNETVEFLRKHGARRDSGMWLSRDQEILSADPVRAARRLRMLLIENSHRDKDGARRTLHRLG